MFQVCNELMVIADGNEIYIVKLIDVGFLPGKHFNPSFVCFPLTELLCSGERCTVAEIAETAKLLEMTLLGLIRQGSTEQLLALHAGLEVTVQEGDKIIVIADLVN